MSVALSPVIHACNFLDHPRGVLVPLALGEMKLIMKVTGSDSVEFSVVWGEYNAAGSTIASEGPTAGGSYLCLCLISGGLTAAGSLWGYLFYWLCYSLFSCNYYAMSTEI